jgi:hypothetical protein
LPGIVPAVLALAQDPAAAAVKVGQAQAIVRQRQAAAMGVLCQAL